MKKYEQPELAFSLIADVIITSGGGTWCDLEGRNLPEDQTEAFG